MRKREFLRRLGQELSHLDRDERNDILDYYDELIEDRIEKTGNSESDVIYDLGEIEDIARRVDPTHRRKFKYEEEEELPRKKIKKKKVFKISCRYNSFHLLNSTLDSNLCNSICSYCHNFMCWSRLLCRWCYLYLARLYLIYKCLGAGPF